MKIILYGLILLSSMSSFAAATSYCERDAIIVAKRMLYARSLANSELTSKTLIAEEATFSSVDDIKVSNVEVLKTMTDEITGAHQETLLVSIGKSKGWDLETVQLSMEFGNYWCSVISPIIID